jgi:type IV pilus assembly protein PilM
MQERPDRGRRDARAAFCGERRMPVRARTAVGLDIGTSSVRAAELALGRGGMALTRFGQVALPEGAVRAGEVVDPAAVTQAVKQLWAQARFTTKKVVIGVANQKVVVRQVDLPWMPLAELKAALAMHVQDFVPMPVEQALLDLHPLEELTNEDGARLHRVLLVAAARDMVDATLGPVIAAGLKPVMVDLTSFAVLRSLVKPDLLGLDEPDAEAIVDVGARVTNIVVHQAGVPRFVRILLLGGAALTDAVAERLGIPIEAAEAVKQATGLAALAGGSLDSTPEGRVLESAGEQFLEQVRASLDYYVAQPGSVRISRLLLSGGGGQLPGLAERLAAATRLPVSHATPLDDLALGKTGLTQEQLDYVAPLATVPVGLALGVAS